MLAPHVIQQIAALLAEGRLSQRRIAVLLGVSRGTIGAIAAGNRPEAYVPPPADGDEDQPAGPAARCPGCGGLVYLPCRLCRVRAWQRKRIARQRWRPNVARRSAT